MRTLLDHQADGIEYTLHSHGLEASVVGGNISPRLIQFHIKLGAGVKYNRVAALAEELALALGVTHCRITRDGYFVKIEVPRPDPVAVRLFPLMRNLPGDLPPNAPVLGLDESGVPLLLRLDSPDIAHILISGTTGSGKTVLARSMIASLALQNTPDKLKLLLIDPKGRGYRDFNGLPNLVCPVVTDPQDGLHRLKWAVRHMEKRDETGVNSPILVIFIDELADLIMVNGKEMEQQVTRLTQRGREAGIHLVACTQKPAASVIGGIAKSNFPTRLVGRVVSGEDARVASGVAGSGADKLMGRGDFLLFARGETSRVQSAHISPEEMRQTVEHLGGVPVGPERSRRPEQEPQLQERQVSPARRRSGERQFEESRQPASRQFRRPNQGQAYEPDYEDDLDYADDADDHYESAPRTGNLRGKRQFQTALANTFDDNSERALGIAERLSRYQETIQQHRETAKPRRRVAEAGEEETYYNPARAQREQERSRPRRTAGVAQEQPKPRVPNPVRQERDAWNELDDELELEPGAAGSGRLDDDFEDEEEYEEPARPLRSSRPVAGTTPPLKPIPSRPQPGEEDRTSLLSSVKTRTGGSFKMGS